MTMLASPSPAFRPFERWTLTVLLTLALLAAGAAAHSAAGGGTDGIRAVIRLTARTSLVLFCAAFAASALVRLAPSAGSRWMMRNRRHLGLSFAVSHLIHAGAIVGLVRSDPALFWQLSSVGSLVAGGSAYVAIAAMAATSFDRAAAALGPRAWKALHWWGGHFIWLSFLLTNGKRVPLSGWYLVPLALLALVMALRWRAGRRAAREG